MIANTDAFARRARVAIPRRLTIDPLTMCRWLNASRLPVPTKLCRPNERMRPGGRNAGAGGRKELGQRSGKSREGCCDVSGENSKKYRALHQAAQCRGCKSQLAVYLPVTLETYTLIWCWKMMDFAGPASAWFLVLRCNQMIQPIRARPRSIGGVSSQAAVNHLFDPKH